MNITNKAKQLIQLHSIKWLSEKLGVSRVTIYDRLEKDNWKKLEIEKLLKLS